MEPDTARSIAYDNRRDRRDPSSVALKHEALALLTRDVDEPFELHMLRIAHARGRAGEVARAIKIAELDDLVARSADDPLRWDQPPYAWARRHLVWAEARSDRGRAAASAVIGQSGRRREALGEHAVAQAAVADDHGVGA